VRSWSAWLVRICIIVFYLGCPILFFHNLLTGAVRHWMGEDYWGDSTVDRPPGRYAPDLDGFKHNQQPLLARVMTKYSMITTKLRLSKIVTPFPVFEQHWDPNAVVTMADDRGGRLDVKLLELLCFTRTQYKNKASRALKMKNDALPKSINRGYQSIWSERNKKTVR